MFKYESTPNPYGNTTDQWLFKFENGYGASVITGYNAYINLDHPFELAVIKWDGDNEWSLEYRTSITDDVIGYNTIEDINKLLDQIKDLPPIKE